MASSSNQQIKRLSELLNEQQEPFVLQIYLLERGCYFRNKYSSAQYLSSIGRNLLNKIVFKKWRRKKKRKKDKELVTEPTIGRCSLSSFTTFSTTTWSNSDADDAIADADADADADITHNQAYKQCSCSLISFVEEIDLVQAVPFYNVRQTQEEMLAGADTKNRFQDKLPEDSILSDSLWDMLVQVRSQNPNKNRKQHIRKPFPNYNSKPALQQRKQLLFEYETKIVEDRIQQNQDSYKGLIMGSQEIGRIICRNLKMWGKISAHETNIQQVLKMDLLEDDGKYHEVWRKGICREIGNGIFDEIIQEIIKDLCCQY